MTTTLGHSHLNGKHKSWVIPSSIGKDYAKCRFCNKDFKIGSMGATALNSHAIGFKHKSLVLAAASQPPVRQVPPTTATAGNTSNSLSVPDTTINNSEAIGPDSTTGVSRSSSIKSYCTNLHSDDVLRAEIWWTLQTIVTNNSFSSNSDVGEIFQKMVYDSVIANSYKCAETKTKYVTENGLHVFFKSLLLNNIANNTTTKWFVVLFDESLNDHLQKKQLDFHIRMWDIDKVVTRYIHSEFLGTANAQVIFECFEILNQMQSLYFMLQVSMDGPSVNLAAYKLIEGKSQSDYEHGLLDIGSCGIHQVHNALKAAMGPGTNESPGYMIGQFLNALFHLFHECPARRAQYQKATGSDVYPKSFATHRWADNNKAAVRAAEMVPYLKQYIKALNDRTKGMVKPTCNSYSIVKEFIEDKFVYVKLEFFKHLSEDIESFLVIFQYDRPMAPFLIREMNDLILRVARRFLTSDHCTEFKTKTLKLQIHNSAHYVTARKIHLGFAANKLIDTMVGSGAITREEFKAFKEDGRDVCIRFIAKLHGRSPVHFDLASHLACLDPKLIVNRPNLAVSKFTKTLKCVEDVNLIDVNECNQCERQFQNFVDTCENNSEFKGFIFDKKENRLDTLYHTALYGKHEYRHIWKVICQLLLISHGQATVERGFSINKHCTFVNQSKESLVARRSIRDHVNYAGGLLKVELTPQLLKECRSANKKYKDRLRENKEKKAQAEKNTKKEELEKKIEDKKQKIKVTEVHIKAMEDDIKKSIKLAANKERTQVVNHDLLLAKANQGFENISAKNDELVKLNEELVDLRNKIKSTM